MDPNDHTASNPVASSDTSRRVPEDSGETGGHTGGDTRTMGGGPTSSHTNWQPWEWSWGSWNWKDWSEWPDKWTTGWSQSEDRREDKEFNRDYSAPPNFPGLDHLPIYRDALRRWCGRSAIKPQHRAGRVIEGMNVDYQEKLRQLPREQLDCEEGVDNLLAHLSLIRGERARDDERLPSAKHFTMWQYGNQRA